MKQEYMLILAGLAGLYIFNKNKENNPDKDTGEKTGNDTGTGTSGNDTGTGTSGDLNNIGNTIAKDAGAIAAVLTAITGVIMAL